MFSDFLKKVIQYINCILFVTLAWSVHHSAINKFIFLQQNMNIHMMWDTLKL